MNKAELMGIAERYNMEFIRDHVTRQGAGVYCKSAALIPELDAITDNNRLPVVWERTYAAGEYLYRIFCPSAWIDLWGWA